MSGPGSREKIGRGLYRRETKQGVMRYYALFCDSSRRNVWRVFGTLGEAFAWRKEMIRQRENGGVTVPRRPRRPPPRRVPPCDRCNHRGEEWHFERHHRNRNRRDNRPENLEWLCIPCHRKEHRRRR